MLDYPPTFPGLQVERWGSHGTVVQYPISDCGTRVLPVAVMDALWVAYPDGIPKGHLQWHTQNS